MKKLLLIGGGGHALSCIDVIESMNKYEVNGIIINNKNENLTKYKIIGCDNDLLSLRKSFEFAFIGIGQIKDFKIREKYFLKLKKLNYILPVIISKLAYLSSESKILEGTIVMHQANINTSCHVGYNCIINSKSLIEHNVYIGDNCHISTGAIINGGSKIGPRTFIGSGSIIHENISIGKECIITAGSVIKNDIKDRTIIK